MECVSEMGGAVEGEGIIEWAGKRRGEERQVVEGKGNGEVGWWRVRGEERWVGEGEGRGEVGSGGRDGRRGGYSGGEGERRGG